MFGAGRGGFGGGFGAVPQPAQPAALGGMFGGGQGAAPGGFGSAVGGGMMGGGIGLGAGGGAALNRWVPDTGEERYVTSMGLRGSISSLSWFSNGYLALTTWDGEIQVLEVAQSGPQVQAKLSSSARMAPAGQAQGQPILCSVCQGESVAVGMADNKLRSWNVQGGPTAVTELGAHEAPIRRVTCLDASWPAQGYLTGGLDKRVCLWRQGSTTPAATLALSFKVFAD